MDTNVTLQTNCDLQEAPKTSPTKDNNKKALKNGEGSPSSLSDDSDIEVELVNQIHHNTKEDTPDEEDSTSTFFQRYFSNQSNSLPSRLASNYARRLSQCREEDEDEEKKDIVPSSMSTISGSDKSLSESSSGSKTSVIDTITGPTHKFVITKTKTSEIKEETKPAEETKPDESTKELSEAAKIFANRKQYGQANTVHGIPGYDPRRPPASSLFKSPLQSPHYDAKFFDSSLIELKSETSSIVDCSTITEDIWVKRTDLEAKKVSLLIFIKNKKIQQTKIPLTLFPFGVSSTRDVSLLFLYSSHSSIIPCLQNLCQSTFIHLVIDLLLFFILSLFFNASFTLFLFYFYATKIKALCHNVSGS